MIKSVMIMRGGKEGGRKNYDNYNDNYRCEYEEI